MHLSAARTKQAHSPAAAGQQCIDWYRYVTIGGCMSPQKCRCPWWIWIPSNISFFGLTRVCPPNGISINSAVFAQLTQSPVCPTHLYPQTTLRATYVEIGRIYAQRVVMATTWPVRQNRDYHTYNNMQRNKGINV